MADKQRRRARIKALRAGKRLPINKGSGEPSIERRLPQITGKKTIAALGAFRSMVRGAFGNLKVSVPPGRNERFESLITRVLDASPLIDDIEEILTVRVRVNVFEGFGKPTLVSFDVLIVDRSDQLDEVRDDYLARSNALVVSGDSSAEAEDSSENHEQTGLGVLGSDLFDRVVSAVWNNPEMAPIGVRGRVIAVHGEVDQDEANQAESLAGTDLRPNEELLFDMRDLGYVDEIARVDDLYQRYGAPAFDPLWRP